MMEIVTDFSQLFHGHKYQFESLQWQKELLEEAIQMSTGYRYSES